MRRARQPIAGVTGEALAIGDSGRGEYAASVEEAVERLVAQAEEGDLIMTLGAGSVSQAGAVVLERLAAGLEEGVLQAG